MSERLEELSQWLREVVTSNSFHLEEASQDASFRRYFRVSFDGQSLILMDAPPAKEDSSPFVKVARLLQQAGVQVPQVLESNLAKGMLLLTDLGTRHYSNELNATNVDQLYADAMSALLKIQTRVSAQAVPCYDDALLRAEMDLFVDWFLQRHLQLLLTQAQRRSLLSCFDLLSRSAQSQPQVFVHRDYHSRNLMVRASDNPGVLDFQGALCGPVTYDLVSLLRDVYIRWPEARVRKWALDYQQHALRAGLLHRDDWEQWLKWFDWMGVQRHLKIAGIFSRLYHRDGKVGYLHDVPLTLQYLCSVSSRYRELAPLSQLMRELHVEERLETRNASILRHQ
jgi:aminoglycoside/choline kinase family phosphotransferase